MTITKQFLNLARKKEDERKKKFIYKKNPRPTRTNNDLFTFKCIETHVPFVINLF